MANPKINNPFTRHGSMALPLSKNRGSPMKKNAMAKKELNFMKKKGAPKSMIKAEMAEHGMKKFAGGGVVRGAGAAVKGKKFSRSC